MRPSVTEQLEGLRRILEDVVAPELGEPYPRDILAGVCATLESIAQGWQQIPAFLDWDARASDDLVAGLGDSGDGSENGPAVEPDPFDIAQLEARHGASRAALERAIQALAGRDDEAALTARIATHLRERQSRYPLKTVWRLKSAHAS